MKKLIFAALLVSFLAPAHAAPVAWELQDFQFNDGGMAYGSFVYDSDTDQIYNIDIYTTGGSMLSGRHYISTAGVWGSAPQIGTLAFSNQLGPDFTNAGWLRIHAYIDFNASPGTIVNQWLAVGAESFCVNSSCNSAANEISNPGESRDIVSGYLLAARQIPEPSPFALSAIGLAMLASRGTRARLGNGLSR